MLGSLGLLGTIGSASALDFFDSPEAKACMAAVAEQDRQAIEAFLAENPDSSLIPAMLSALRPDVLAQLRPSAVQALPRPQLDRLSPGILLQFGLVSALPQPAVGQPAQPRVTTPKANSQY